jgi:hypothetical protein
MNSKPITPCKPEPGRGVMIPAWIKVEVICAICFSKLAKFNVYPSITWVLYFSFFYTDF